MNDRSGIVRVKAMRHVVTKTSSNRQRSNLPCREFLVDREILGIRVKVRVGGLNSNRKTKSNKFHDGFETSENKGP